MYRGTSLISHRHPPRTLGFLGLGFGFENWVFLKGLIISGIFKPDIRFAPTGSPHYELVPVHHTTRPVHHTTSSYFPPFPAFFSSFFYETSRRSRLFFADEPLRSSTPGDCLGSVLEGIERSKNLPRQSPGEEIFD